MLEYLEVAKRLAELLLDLLPHEEVKVLLDDAARRRAESVARAAEEAKFGG